MQARRDNPCLMSPSPNCPRLAPQAAVYSTYARSKHNLYEIRRDASSFTSNFVYVAIHLAMSTHRPQPPSD